jgi:hypothetical protein
VVLNLEGSDAEIISIRPAVMLVFIDGLINTKSSKR